MIHESTVTKAWEHTLDDGTSTLTCFILDGVPEHAFLGTRVRVMASEPVIVSCDDPLCGDGCCDDPGCTNVPEEERQQPFLLRADTVEWL